MVKDNTAASLQTGIKVGLVGGTIAVFIALEGMMQAFSARDIISGVVSMSQMLLLMTFFVTGYLAVVRSGCSRPVTKYLVGAVAALVASALLVVLIALGSVINLGEVLINATDRMYELLTFQQGLLSGSAFLLILGAVSGLVATAVSMAPARARGPVVNSLVAIVSLGLLQDLVRVTLSEFDFLTPVVRFFYETNGLSLAGTICLLVLVGLISVLWSPMRQRLGGGLTALPAASRRRVRWGGIVAGFIILLLVPRLLGLYLTEVLDTVGLYLLMGLGLNIVVGFAGLLDLGYVAFFAIGAYAMGVLTSPELSSRIFSNWWVAVPFAVAVAVMAGVILGIPVLRMRGDYLAIVTLGFGEIIRLLALSDFLKPWLGGAQGIQGIAKPDIAFIQVTWTPQTFYYVILAGCLLVAFVAIRVKNSRLGRAWMAVREDEDVAQATGINLVSTKLLAFALGAAFGGLSGAIFASKLDSIYPHSFNFLVSINVLSLIIVGGMGSIPGVIVGAFLLLGLPELTREFADYRFLFYGIALVAMMLVRPEGFWPEAAHKRELHETAPEESKPPPDPASCAVA